MSNSVANEEKVVKKTVKRDITGVTDLQKVTDYAEEKEISDKDITKAISIIGDIKSREDEAKNEQQKNLSKIICKKEDIDLIVQEMEITRHQAELKLREHGGNVVETLIELTN